jgi:hypothetical protein
MDKTAEAENRLLTLDTMITGHWIDKRPELIKKHCREGSEIILVPEPQNPADKNAIMVCIPTMKQIGYLTREDAEQVAPLMKAGCKYSARVKLILLLDSGQLRPVIVANFYNGTFSDPGLRDSNQFTPSDVDLLSLPEILNYNVTAKHQALKWGCLFVLLAIFLTRCLSF